MHMIRHNRKNMKRKPLSFLRFPKCFRYNRRDPRISQPSRPKTCAVQSLIKFPKPPPRGHPRSHPQSLHNLNWKRSLQSPCHKQVSPRRLPVRKISFVVHIFWSKVAQNLFCATLFLVFQARAACIKHQEPLSLCGGSRAKRRGASLAGTDTAELIVAVDPGVMPIGKVNLNRIAADRRCGLRPRLGFEHWEHRRCRRQWYRRRAAVSVRRIGFFPFRVCFFFAFIVTRRARARVAQVRKIIVTGVTVGPGNIHSSAARNMNFYGNRFFAGIERSRHLGRPRKNARFGFCRHERNCWSRNTGNAAL